MSENYQYTFTVFTPTYNRAGLLPRVYESLKQQTFKDFEWLIVDDGSTDNTKEVVEGWLASAPFPIRYIAKPNGGKHTAINLGCHEAKGAFFAILDSDDWYAPQSLERFQHYWNLIPAAEQSGFCGVVGLCSYPTGETIGSRFPRDIFDSDVIDLRYKYKIDGEKNGVLRTQAVREFPFPEDIGKFIGESIVWNRMAKKYRTRFVNEVLTIKEFQKDGLTNTGRVIQVRNTRASLLSSRELISLGSRLPLKPRVKAYANYVRHSLHQGIPFGQQIAGVPSKALFCFCYPLGWYLKRGDQNVVEAGAKA